MARQKLGENKLPLRSILFLIFLSFLNLESKAQLFGSSYDFLIKETNARVSAIGGVNNSLRDGDVQLVHGNPAVVNGKMAKTLGMTVNPGISKTAQYNAAYADSLGKWGNWFTTLAFLDYGKLKETDITGFQLGEFSASQYAFSFGTAQKKGNFFLGAALKFAGFQVQGNQSFAAVMDLGAFYQHPKKQLTFGFSAKNIGATIKKFDTNLPMPVPFNVQASFSYKLEHMPLRISGSAYYIQEPNIQYVDPNAPGTIDLNGVEIKPKKKLSEQIARHLTLGGEFLLHRSFHLRVGYNHLRRKELRPTTGAGLTGFSLGCAINIKAFNFSYTYSGWQSNGGNQFISLNIRMADFYSR